MDGATIKDKELPYDISNPPKEAPRANELGVWRSHANVWRQILTDNIATALILEDDVDFSRHIRDILAPVSTHLPQMTGSSPDAMWGLEKGNEWDVLSLGTCWNESPPAKEHPNFQLKPTWIDKYAPPRGGQRTRQLQYTFVAVCTQGYVVTKAGAGWLLYNMGGPGARLNKAVDMAMLDAFRSGRLRGYTVVPSVFAQFKYGDGRDSDVQPMETQTKDKGSGNDIVEGVRGWLGELWGPRRAWKTPPTPPTTQVE